MAQLPLKFRVPFDLVVGLLQLGVGDRTLEPAVVGLTRDLEHPARHRNGDPVHGQLADERVHL